MKRKNMSVPSCPSVLSMQLRLVILLISAVVFADIPGETPPRREETESKNQFTNTNNNYFKSSNISNVVRLYTHGDLGYPCFRIPATVAVQNGIVLAFASARCFTGDSCYPLTTTTPTPAPNPTVTTTPTTTATGSIISSELQTQQQNDENNQFRALVRSVRGEIKGYVRTSYYIDEKKQEQRRRRPFTSIVVRRSVDGGRTFGPILTVHTSRLRCGLTSEPTVIFDAMRNRTTVFFNDALSIDNNKNNNKNNNRNNRSNDRNNNNTSPIRTSTANTNTTTTRQYSLASDDAGLTWNAEGSAPRLLRATAQDPLFNAGTHIAPATGIQLSTTHKLAPGRMLAVAILESSCALDRVMYSDDHGASWTLSKTSLPHNGEAQLVELGDDGRIGFNGRTKLPCPPASGIIGNKCRMQAFSTDAGVTWSTPQLTAATPGENCMATLLSHPTNRSIVYLAHPGNLTRRANGLLYRSTDGMKTWNKTPYLISPGAQFAYSSLSHVPGREDVLGLTYETHAQGCEAYAPACAIVHTFVPTTW